MFQMSLEIQNMVNPGMQAIGEIVDCQESGLNDTVISNLSQVFIYN
jgi:hypothetical protein